MTAETDPTTAQWWALELAFGHVTPGHRSFLDRHTGRVLTLRAQDPDDVALLRRMAAAGPRYLHLEPVCSREQYAWLVQFIATVADPGLRASLGAAITGPAAFRAFKDVLHAHPDERARWLALRKDLLRAHIERWFAARDLPPVQPAPDLRALGHRLLAELPAAELPTTVAFLMHLGARGDLQHR